MNSVRRFCCLPDSVSLVAIGFLEPYPFAVRRDVSIPFVTIYATTAFARCCDKFSFIAADPVLSVCPLISIFNFGASFINFTNRSNSAFDSIRNVAFPKSKKILVMSAFMVSDTE